MQALFLQSRGFSSMHGDEWVIYQAAIVMPSGIGASIWDSTEYAEHSSRPYGDPVDALRDLLRIWPARRWCEPCSWLMPAQCLIA